MIAPLFKKKRTHLVCIFAMFIGGVVLLSSIQRIAIRDYVDDRSHTVPISYLITNMTYNNNDQQWAIDYNIQSSTSQQLLRHNRKLQSSPTTTNCPPKPKQIPPPQNHPLHNNALHQSTYAVSFPGSGDKMITKYFIESITGLYVGEASISPSLEKMQTMGINGITSPEAQEQLKKKQEQLIKAENGGTTEQVEVRDGEGGLISGEVRGQGEVVAVRTQFPHTSGKLASWDDDIPRAFVILRNPLHALPCYFDRLYEIRNHLPTGSSSLPEYASDIEEQWLKWRDNQLPSQLKLYRRFVSFWMEKYLGNDGSRIFFKYEDFVNEESGPLESVRLYNFLHESITSSTLDWVMSSMGEDKGENEDEGGEGLPLDAYLKEGLTPAEVIEKAMEESTTTVVNLEDVPCIWKEVVYNTIQSSYEKKGLPLQQEDGDETISSITNSNGYSFDGGDWNPTDRPFTAENLAAMSQMLLELMNRWSRHQRLLATLSVYHREVNRAYLDSTGKLEDAIKERDELSKVVPDSLEGGQQGQQQEQQSVVSEGEPTQQQEESPPVGHQSSLPFHIIQASPPNNNDASIVATNWLVGLFEPEKDVTFMNGWPESQMQQSGRDATLDSSIVKTTNNLDLLYLYKLIRPRTDEVFFVVTKDEGSDPNFAFDDAICGYKNCLCLEHYELLYNNEDELRAMVISLTEKFRSRFEYYFGMTAQVGEVHEFQALERLNAMSRVMADMVNQPTDKIDFKYGVHGGYQSEAEIPETDPGEVADPVPLHRRRLSTSLPNGGCEVTWPQPPKKHVQTAYAASYPGCGARMTWNLIEALTGLWTGDDWDNNNRGKRVVTVKTHYPHNAGQLVTWDDEINRALVIIRNPMAAIPSFFNHIYEMQNNLPVHSQRAPVADWIEWRDRVAMDQITKFGKFVDYWMERFDSFNGDRIFVSYEVLTDDNDGPAEAVRINNFLAQSEGVEPIATESVPCIWRTVVKHKQELASEEDPSPNRKILSDGRRRLDPNHHDSQRTGPTERPYTPELLDAMSKMLSDLIERWGERHLRLRTVLEGYQAIVHAGYLDTIKQSTQDNNASQILPLGKKFHLFLVSKSGSTVLNNLLTGLFDPDADYKKSPMISKAHDFDLLSLYKSEKDKYDEIFFVVIKDPSAQMDTGLCDYDNSLCIEHNELLYNNQGELLSMVGNLGNKLQSRFQYFFGPDFINERKKMDAVKRLESMDKAIAALDGGDPSNGGNKKVKGSSFHIFQISPPSPHTSASIYEPTVATNWLMGLFEPDKDYSFMINNPELTVRQHNTNVPIDTTIVTKTHVLDLMMLYKQYRPQFDEVLFVVYNPESSSQGLTAEEVKFDAAMCEYDNVLCLDYGDVFFADGEIEKLVINLTAKFRARFEYFFGPNSDLLSEDKMTSAVRRLEDMAKVATSLANEPFSVSESKYGVHGAGASSQIVSATVPGKLFYCGGAHDFLKKEIRAKFRYSTFGLVLAKSLFPDFEGDISILANNKVDVSATPLMEDTVKDATSKDLLIMHSHQHCEVDVIDFPGTQLYINVEYYDIHPKHLDNIDGKLTWDYLPPGDRAFVLGPHEDTSRSIRIPYISMRLWYLHTTGRVDLRQVFDPLHKPRNTKENFMLYINSHYIEYRERAARAIAEQIGTIHVAGKCQGNFEANPPQPSDDSPIKCVPFDNDRRPPSILSLTDQLGTDNMHKNSDLFSKYRYALVMENADVPGYISEKLLAAFLSGTVPIYYGSRFVFEIFNPKAFIFFDLDIPHQALNEIQYFEQNPEAYEKMLSEPILANGQETIDKYFSWDESVGNGRLKARIRDMLGLQKS